MFGYRQNPEATAEAIDRAAWMHTGDPATMDEADYVRIGGGMVAAWPPSMRPS
jgi:fatty-acyl-CoA synthase